jgi:hypothetical protein
MIDLPYSLVVEATKDPDFFGFYSLELEGFTGVGHSVEDCLYQALGYEGSREALGSAKSSRAASQSEPDRHNTQ